MTLMTNKLSITAKEQIIMTTDYVKPTWSIEEVIADCEISKKALGLIANLKAVLTTEDLRYEFMMRVPFDPTGSDVGKLVNQMRDEQLMLNPMSHESFLDIYLLNPIAALTQYFKHHVVAAQIERMKQWGINIKDVVGLKQINNTIHLNDALEMLC